jgi:hypothetical protein
VLCDCITGGVAHIQGAGGQHIQEAAKAQRAVQDMSANMCCDLKPSAVQSSITRVAQPTLFLPAATNACDEHERDWRSRHPTIIAAELSRSAAYDVAWQLLGRAYPCSALSCCCCSCCLGV